MKRKNNMAKPIIGSSEWRLQEALNLARAAQAKKKLDNKTIQYLQKLAGLKSEGQKIDRNFTPAGGYSALTPIPYRDPYGNDTTRTYFAINGVDVGGKNVRRGDVSPKSKSPLAWKATPPTIGERDTNRDNLVEEEQALLNEYRSGRIKLEPDLNGGVMWVWHPENGFPEEGRIRNAALEGKLTPERKFSEDETNTYNKTQDYTELSRISRMPIIATIADRMKAYQPEIAGR